jgi:hypothetical protein
MKHLPLVLVWLIALAVGEVAPWPLPPPNPSVQEREGTVETKQRVEEPPRQLVSGGTPTGGGTYPFLAIVNYDDAADEPFVSDEGIGVPERVVPHCVLTVSLSPDFLCDAPS